MSPIVSGLFVWISFKPVIEQQRSRDSYKKIIEKIMPIWHFNILLVTVFAGQGDGSSGSAVFGPGAGVTSPQVSAVNATNSANNAASTASPFVFGQPGKNMSSSSMKYSINKQTKY